MKYVDRIVGTIIVILLAYFAANFILSYTPVAVSLTPTYLRPIQLFLSYRLFDVLFLAFLVFAAITAVAALFRPEKITVEEAFSEEGGEVE